MGVRIDVYAVDTAEMNILASTKLHHLLWYYADQPCVSNDLPILRLYEDEHPRIYHASPEYGVYSMDRSQKKKTVLSKEDSADLLFLSSTLADFYSHQSSFAFRNLLECLSACPTIEWVYQVSQGHRRWWIGSFLDSAVSVLGTNSQEYALLAMLFQKMLREYDCGKALPKQQYDLSDFTFPIMPEDDTDNRMGIWVREETHSFLQILDAITTPTMPMFKAPSGKVGIAPDTDDAWNQWVQEIIGEFLYVKTLPFKDLNLLSFIS